MKTIRTAIAASVMGAIAVTGAERIEAAPEIPTVAESGLAGFEAGTWFGIVAPAGTPAEVITRINAEVRSVLGMPDVRERILATGNEPWWSTPEEFGRFIQSEATRFGKVIKEAGIKGE